MGSNGTGELLIEGGTLVTAADSYRADLLIRNGKISCIGNSLQSDVKAIDAGGMLVMPGGIDAHVHLAHSVDRIGLVTAEDFYTGTVAAACGGVTSIVDFALQRRGQSLEQAVIDRMRQAEGEAVIDYGFHIIVTDVRRDVLEEMPRLIGEGFPSFKIYMTYTDKVVDDAGLIKVLEQTAEHGGLVFAHCENDCGVNHLIADCRGRGDMAPIFHAKTRPPIVEGEATNRAIALAELVGAPLCIAHVTSMDALERVEAARHRGNRVYSETCPQYLTLTEEHYDPVHGFEAAKFVCSPPLRGAMHRSALWEGLRRRSIQQVSSDHCPWRFADQKQHGKEDFTLIPNGVPGIETRLPVLFSEGVSSGKISANRFVELVSTNPAKLFGLYPEKGSLAIGADADLVLIDPERETVVDYRALHHQVDYSPFDGMKLRGLPVLTISRGEVVSVEGEPQVERGRGRFLKRRRFELRDQL